MGFELENTARSGDLDEHWSQRRHYWNIGKFLKKRNLAKIYILTSFFNRVKTSVDNLNA